MAVFQSFKARASTFPYHQIKVEYPLLRAAANYWVPSWHAFSFNRIELCPIIEEFATIMGELDIDDLILPTMANRWCVLGKLNLRLVLDYFSDSALFEGKRLQSYFLCAF